MGKDVKHQLRSCGEKGRATKFVGGDDDLVDVAGSSLKFGDYGLHLVNVNGHHAGTHTESVWVKSLRT